MSGLRLWTIYDHPADFPEVFVVRGFTAEVGGPIADRHVRTATTLDGARSLVPPGLVCIARYPTDDPKIVETWL